MDKPFVKEERFLGLSALRFGAGGYEAVFVPEAGGNLVRLRDCETGAEVLRFPTPNEMEEASKKLALKSSQEHAELCRQAPNEQDMIGEAFKANNVVYGIPVLFFPNRIVGGSFIYNGKRYDLPKNSGDNHLHGFLHNRAWSVAETTVTADEAPICAVFRHDSEVDSYKYFPHDFTFHLTYTISENGLRQDVEIRNDGETAMPFGLGFHTAFNIPFCGGTAQDYSLRMNIDKKWEVHGMIPTGNFVPLTATELELNSGGILPDEHILDEMLYTLLDGEIVLQKQSDGMKVRYDWDEKYRFAVLWNNGGGKGFVCAEPQTWAVNAPNIPLPNEVTGFAALAPKETWRAACRIAIEK